MKKLNLLFIPLIRLYTIVIFTLTFISFNLYGAPSQNKNQPVSLGGVEVPSYQGIRHSVKASRVLNKMKEDVRFGRNRNPGPKNLDPESVREEIRNIKGSYLIIPKRESEVKAGATEGNSSEELNADLTDGRLKPMTQWFKAEESQATFQSPPLVETQPETEPEVKAGATEGESSEELNAEFADGQLDPLIQYFKAEESQATLLSPPSVETQASSDDGDPWVDPGFIGNEEVASGDADEE